MEWGNFYSCVSNNVTHETLIKNFSHVINLIDVIENFSHTFKREEIWIPFSKVQSKYWAFKKHVKTVDCNLKKIQLKIAVWKITCTWWILEFFLFVKEFRNEEIKRVNREGGVKRYGKHLMNGVNFGRKNLRGLEILTLCT